MSEYACEVEKLNFKEQSANAEASVREKDLRDWVHNGQPDLAFLSRRSLSRLVGSERYHSGLVECTGGGPVTLP